MSTTGIENWAVDLKDVGAIYPFQGSEGLMVIIGVALWLVWHVWCTRWEGSSHDEKVRKYGNQESLNNALNSD